MCPSQDPPHPTPCKDKGKQCATDQQQKKRKWVVEVDSEGATEVREGMFMAYVRRVERRDRYVSFNPIDDYRRRVENIE